MALIRGGAVSAAIYMQMTNIFLLDGRFLYSIESILAKRIKIAVPGRRFSLVGRFHFNEFDCVVFKGTRGEG